MERPHSWEQDRPKRIAQSAVNAAVKRGQMPPQTAHPCITCGAGAREYHHHRGYEPVSRLEVVPLCRPCHRSIHRRPPTRQHRPQRTPLPFGKYVTMQEAAEILGVSRFQMSALVKRLKLKVYETPADRRRKLLKRDEVEALAKPRPNG